MSNSIVIGLDIGHSAVKMTYDAKGNAVQRALFQSLASPAITIRNEAEAQIAMRETVTVAGRQFFVGDTAALQGKASLSSGLSSDWISSDEHSALIHQAKKIVDENAPQGKRIYVLGLPVEHFETHKEKLKSVAEKALGDAEIRIMPQPMGAYQCHMLNRGGMPQAERSMSNESWAIVDVGYYSTDFVLIMEGRWVEAASGGCPGVRMAAEHLQRLIEKDGIQRDLVDAEKALRDGFIRHFGQRIPLEEKIMEAQSVVSSKVSDMAAQLMSHYVQSIDGVIVTGGGASLVFDTLKARWPHTQLVNDRHQDGKPAAQLSGSRFVVSEGFYRYGRSLNLIRNMTNKAA